MNKYVKLVIGVVALAIVIWAANALYSKLSDKYELKNEIVIQENTEVATNEVVKDDMDNQTQDATQEDIKAPDFKMLDYDGEETSLYAFTGKPIVINFWASWCGPCKSELPDFQETYEKYGEDVEFLMVNMTDGMRETIDVAKKYIENGGYTFPVYFDTTQEAAYNYSVYSIPMTFFIDSDGNLAAYAQGMINSETLEEGIALIYKNN